MADSNSERCVRAAQAAIEVVSEECLDMGMEIVEIKDGMFVEIPTESAERARATEGEKVSVDEFTEIVAEDEFIREWLGEMVSVDGVSDDNGVLYRMSIYGWANSLIGGLFEFTSPDIPQETVDMIAGGQ